MTNMEILRMIVLVEIQQVKSPMHNDAFPIIFPQGITAYFLVQTMPHNSQSITFFNGLSGCQQLLLSSSFHVGNS